jgi:transcriptional regulator with XRE-family HTH domain
LRNFKEFIIMFCCGAVMVLLPLKEYNTKMNCLQHINESEQKDMGTNKKQMPKDEFISRLLTVFKVKEAKDLAELFGVRPSTITSWKNGDNNPQYEKILQKNEVKGINLNWLFFGNGEMMLSDSPQKTAESAYYEQAGRSFERVLECLSNAKSIQSSAEFSEQEEKEVNKKQQGEGKDEERNKPISGTFSGQPDSRTAGQPDSRTAGQPDSRTAGQPDSRTAGQPDSRTAGQLRIGR